MSGAARDDLVFVGDVHLERDDAALSDFVGFLKAVGQHASRVVLIGDLFNIWVGRPELEAPHQSAVLSSLRRLRARGTVVRYLEGNRDYRIADGYAGDAFDDSTDGGIEERHGGVSLFATHGDLVNPRDRQYRAWRAFSRATPVWAAFQLLPRRRRVRIAEGLERRFRSTNIDFKSTIPEDDIRAFAAPRFAAGHDAVVLGHFHVERRIDVETPGGRRTVYILPEWKGSRRHLRVTSEGVTGFVDSPTGTQPR